MALAESEETLWRNKETFLCHHHNQWNQCSPLIFIPVTLNNQQYSKLCGVQMLSAQGKVNSPLQCPARAGGKRDFAILRASRASPKGLSKTATLWNTACCPNRELLLSPQTGSMQTSHPNRTNPLGIDQNGEESASNFCHRLFSRFWQFFPHPVWSHKVSLLLGNDFTCVSSLCHCIYPSFYIAPHTKLLFFAYFTQTSLQGLFFTMLSQTGPVFSLDKCKHLLKGKHSE